MKLRFVTWNMGDSKKSRQQWENELSKTKEWRKLFDADDFDLLVLSTQEDHRAQTLPEAVSVALLPNWAVHRSIVKGPLDVLKKPFTVKLFVFVRPGGLPQYTVKEANICFQKQFGFCSKGTAGIALTFNGENQLIFMGSHFPIVPKDADLGYNRRIKAINTSLRSVFDQLHDNDVSNVVAFWGGDMNFRRNTPVTVNGNAVEDQLTHALTSASLDKNFVEAELMFPPTCKLHACDKHDCPTCRARSDEEYIEKCYDTHREPSHCDRILFYTEGKSVDVNPLVYKSWIDAGSSDSSSVSVSDHNLVYADFSLSF